MSNVVLLAVLLLLLLHGEEVETTFIRLVLFTEDISIELPDAGTISFSFFSCAFMFLLFFLFLFFFLVVFFVLFFLVFVAAP